MATTKPAPSAPAQTVETPPSTALVAPAGGSLTLPSGLLAKLAEEAKAAAALERPSLSKLSLKSGVLSYGGAPVAGNKMEVLVLSASYLNVYYEGRYDANNIKNPNCFAVSETDEGMSPHDNVANPQHSVCKGCPQNEWGSSPTGGRGKACKEKRRLVLMPATAIEGGVDKVKSAELALLDLPVTSVRNYSQFVNTLSVSAGVPPYAAVALLTVVPDAKTQFKVNFQPMRIIPTEELLEAVIARREEALRISLQGYDETANEDEDPDAAPAPAARKPAKF